MGVVRGAGLMRLARAEHVEKLRRGVGVLQRFLGGDVSAGRGMMQVGGSERNSVRSVVLVGVQLREAR